MKIMSFTYKLEKSIASKIWSFPIAYASTHCARVWNDTALWTLGVTSAICPSSKVWRPSMWILRVRCSSPRWASLRSDNPLAYITSESSSMLNNVPARWNRASCVSSITRPASGYTQGGFGVRGGCGTWSGSRLAPCLSCGIPWLTPYKSKISK